MALTKITSKVLGDEFNTSSALAGTAVDFQAAAVFTKTLAADTTFTFSNYKVGDVKLLVLSGDFTITWPTGAKRVSIAIYDGTATNYIQVECTDATTPVFLISYLKEQV